MFLALRKGAPEGASSWQRFVCWVIRARLVSQWCHGGIVIDGNLYHSTFERGPHILKACEWAPMHWDLVDIGGDDLQAKRVFEAACQPPAGRWQKLWWRITKGYDTFSLFAFVGASFRVAWLHYCFELCYRMRTGRKPIERITPETLLYLPHTYKNMQRAHEDA